MIYFIVTTSLFNNCPIREKQYTYGINKLKKIIDNLNINDTKIIIVENNGIRDTFLDRLGCEIFYTRNNFLGTPNKGFKELRDIRDTIDKFNISDDDFIVKMTGRYILNDNSEFMKIISDNNNKYNKNNKYSCVIRFGSYMKPLNYKTGDCITGLIGMSCCYIKKIVYPKEDECVEWKWGKVACQIDHNKVYIVNKLGINICPASNKYFSV